MTAYKSSSFLRDLLVLSSALQINAQDRPGSFGPWQSGPWGLSNKTFDEYLSSPNATGLYSFPGPDISVDYTNPPQWWVEGQWSWTINVTSDIPNEQWADERPNQFFTGSRIQLKAFEDPITGRMNVDDSWQVCVLRWHLGNTRQTFPEELRTNRNDDTCKSVLGQDCVTGLEREAIRRYDASRDKYACSCPDVNEISSCDGEGADFLREVGCVATSESPYQPTLKLGNLLWTKLSDLLSRLAYNATDMNNDWKDNRLEVQAYGGPLWTGRGNVAAYNETGSLAWPLMVLWGYNADHVRDGEDGLFELNAKFMCVRARDAVEGSVVPGVPPEIEGDEDSGAFGAVEGLRSVVPNLVLGLFVSVVGGWAIGL